MLAELAEVTDASCRSDLFASGKGLPASKLDRAPTLIAATQVRAEDPVQDEEDLCATACATYAVLLAAHGRGLAGYWRTPGVLRTPEGRAAGERLWNTVVASWTPVHFPRSQPMKKPSETPL